MVGSLLSSRGYWVTDPHWLGDEQVVSASQSRPMGLEHSLATRVVRMWLVVGLRC